MEARPSYLPHTDSQTPPQRATSPPLRYRSILKSLKTPTPQNSRPRTSVFKELDLDSMPGEHESEVLGDLTSISTIQRPRRQHADSFNSLQSDESLSDYDARSETSDHSMAFAGAQNGWMASWRVFSSSRLMILALVFLVAMPLLYDTPLLGKAGPAVLGVTAGVIERTELEKKDAVDEKMILPRQNTNTNVCNRWSQQSALVNGTIYLYGGRSSNDPSQTSNTWNNDFLSIDVTKSWDISAPSIKGLPQPSGPPPVANGFLWNSYDSLFLYGGEYSSEPTTTPSPYSLWEYKISSKSWKEHPDPKSSAGNNSDGGNQPILGSAEGAGVTVPQLGRGFYFAGHEDPYTVDGWAQPIPRQYLKSLLEFTFPGYTNDGVQSLGGGKTAGSDGVWRNITQGGIQDTAEFPSRADSVLVYVPGYGVSGILVSMGGGTNESFVSDSNASLTVSYTTNTYVFADADERHRRLRHRQLDMVQAVDDWQIPHTTRQSMCRSSIRCRWLEYKHLHVRRPEPDSCRQPNTI